MSAPVDVHAEPGAAGADTDAALQAIVTRCAEGLNDLPQTRQGAGLLTVVLTLIAAGLDAMDADGRRRAFHFLMGHLLNLGVRHGLMRSAGGCGDPDCKTCGVGEAGDTRPVH